MKQSTTTRATRKLIAKEAPATETKKEYPVTDANGVVDLGPNDPISLSMKDAEDKSTGHVIPLPVGEGGAIKYLTKHLLTKIYQSEQGKEANKALRAENGAANRKKAQETKDRNDAKWKEVVRVGAILGYTAEELEKAGVKCFWYLMKKTQKAICLTHNTKMGASNTRTFINFKGKSFELPEAEIQKREELLKIMLLGEFMAAKKVADDLFDKYADQVGVDRKSIEKAVAAEAAADEADNEKE